MSDHNLQSPTSWRQWTLHQWSQALFHHFFEYDDADTPVTRLVITDTTWSSVTGDTSTKPDEVQQAFLDRFPRTRRDLDHHLSSKALRLPLHDFFPYLILTCLVSAASEEQAEAGQFRIRLYELLGMKEGDSPLPFDGLGLIWKKLKDLIMEKRHQGYFCRELVLPNPGIETLIGYSKRLAFPSRKDQQRLASCLNIDALKRNQWLDEPPVLPVLDIIERHLENFSPSFQEEFSGFRKQFLSGEETAAHPFWAAVRGVLRASSQERRSSASRQILDLLLLMEFDEFDEPVLSLLSKTPPPWSSIVSQPLEVPIAGYNRLLVADEDSGELARRLLNGGLSRLDIRSSLLEVVQDGFLIFQKIEGYLVARTLPPEPGPAIVLVRQDFKSAFVSSLNLLVANHPLKPYLNTRWYWLDNLDGQHIPQLPGVRCLAQIARSASISICDGISCKGGSYLGRLNALPEFRLQSSQRLRLNRLSVTPADVKTPILSERTTGWRVLETPELRAGIEGEFEVVAENWAGMRISARRIRFQRDMLTWDYGSPSDSTAWEIEAGRQATASPGTDDRLLWDIGATWNPEQCLETTAPLPGSEPAHDWRHTGVGDLIEALAAIGTTRTLGLAEVEFLDLLRRFLRISEKDYRLLWDVARAWTEAGLLQRISDRRWRAVRYLPQVPRLCVSRTVDGAWRGVVSGLIPAFPGSRLANIARISGMEARWVASVSPWLPPGLVLTATTAEALHGLAKNQELDLEIVMVRSLGDLLAPLDQALRDDDPPSGYSLYAMWDWEQGRFQKFTDANPKMDTSSVFWHRRKRGDQRDYFLACAEDGRKLWSYSRTWTLLADARLLGREVYVYQSSEGLVRRAVGGIHLPVVVGRLAFALSGSASGPDKKADDSINYRYTLFDDTQVEWVGTQLLGWVRRNQEYRRVPEWLRALALARLSNESSILLSTGYESIPISVPASLEPIYRHFKNLAPK